MTTPRLNEQQNSTFWSRDSYGYGLGVRCKKQNGRFGDFGWGGAASAYLAIDVGKELSMYFGCHMLSSPAQGLRSMLYRFIVAELFDKEEFERISREVKSLYNYNLTY
jgi:hypothetical protein